jgi:tetratricopeptide (TPR) repeat protein
LQQELEKWEESQRVQLRVEVVAREQQLEQEKAAALAAQWQAEQDSRKERSAAAATKAQVLDAKAQAREKERKKQEKLAQKKGKRQEKAKQLAIESNSFSEKSPIGDFTRRMDRFMRGMGQVEGPWQDFGKLVGGDMGDSIGAINNMGETLLEQGKHGEALSMFEKASNLSAAALGSGHPETLRFMVNVGASLRLLGRLDEAEAVLDRTLVGMKVAFIPDHPDVLKAVALTACLRSDQGRYEEAIPMLEKTIAAFQSSALRPNPRDVLNAEQNLAGILVEEGRSNGWKEGQFEKANDAIIRVRKRYEELLGPDHRDTLAVFESIVVLVYDYGKINGWEDGELEEAKRLSDRVLAGYEKLGLGVENVNCFATTITAGNIALNLEQYEEALRLIGKGLPGYDIHSGPNHPETLAAKKQFEEMKKALGK